MKKSKNDIFNTIFSRFNFYSYYTVAKKLKQNKQSTTTLSENEIEDLEFSHEYLFGNFPYLNTFLKDILEESISTGLKLAENEQAYIDKLKSTYGYTDNELIDHAEKIKNNVTEISYDEASNFLKNKKRRNTEAQEVREHFSIMLLIEVIVSSYKSIEGNMLTAQYHANEEKDPAAVLQDCFNLASDYEELLKCVNIILELGARKRGASYQNTGNNNKRWGEKKSQQLLSKFKKDELPKKLKSKVKRIQIAKDFFLDYIAKNTNSFKDAELIREEYDSYLTFKKILQKHNIQVDNTRDLGQIIIEFEDKRPPFNKEDYNAGDFQPYRSIRDSLK